MLAPQEANGPKRINTKWSILHYVTHEMNHGAQGNIKSGEVTMKGFLPLLESNGPTPVGPKRATYLETETGPLGILLLIRKHTYFPMSFMEIAHFTLARSSGIFARGSIPNLR